MSAPTSEIPATLDPDLEPGQVIGEYRVDGKIGQGGFGVVFKASHPLIGKDVAIKVLSRKFSVDPEMVERFIAEARAVNQIRNRHIIDIFSFGKLDDGRQYYVMEYLEGETLDVALDRQGKLALPEALPILRAVARALDAAHAKGIAHRDLKPENVFLVRDPDGGVFPKLLDFGIAKLMASEDTKVKTRTGIPIGTPYYMSPEQCRGKDVDHRTDYYAFGVVAYQMLTGVHPIDADDYMTLMMRQLTDEPAAPSTLVPELPPGIDDAIAWLMRKDREERPPNLATAIRALEQVAEDSGIAIPRASAVWDAERTPIPGRLSSVTPVPRASSTAPGSARMAMTGPRTGQGEPAKRSRAPLVIAAVVAAAAIGGGVFFVMSKSEAPPPAPVAAPVPAPPAPAPAPPPPAPAVAPAPPANVIVTVDGVPEGTTVEIAGKPVGVAPGPVQVPRDTAAVVLTFSADGYVAASKAITPDQDQQLSLQLKKKPRAPSGPARHDKDDIIDVFGKKP